jgi:DNA-binding LacI/PurR family transcriptional regulator
MATIRDIAKYAGVSIGTVSNYLNNSDKLAENTRLRIQKAIKELGYYPNGAARSLKSSLTWRIGIVPIVSSDEESIQNPSDAAFQEFLSATNMIAAKNKYSLLLHASVDGIDELEIYKQMIGRELVDGILLLGVMPDDERIKFLLDKKFPFVSFGRSNIKGHNTWVDVDGYIGMKNAVNLLVELGHRKIAWAAPASIYACYYDRKMGYIDSLAEHSIPLREDYIIKSGFRERDGQIAMHQLLDMVDPPTAVIMANDLACFGAMSAMNKRGFIPGKDISIIGFDDIIAAEHWSPSLTTVRQPIRAVGVKAMEMLIDVIHKKKVEAHIFKPDIIKRASTGFNNIK